MVVIDHAKFDARMFSCFGEVKTHTHTISLFGIDRVTILCAFSRFVLIFKDSVLEKENVLISKKRAYSQGASLFYIRN